MARYYYLSYFLNRKIVQEIQVDSREEMEHLAHLLKDLIIPQPSKS
jgi:hypothetical protein